ncbi:hypothetical protein QYF61_009356 [Mycteria americana]|uniref:Reverse transcriptase n=1 Tax=Mycteria americana TaxID=33587 RepID=A0AAN7NMS1_MYCAM|nr:hypothetical protein QYF61_009356 [Mycteria americana]
MGSWAMGRGRGRSLAGLDRDSEAIKCPQGPDKQEAEILCRTIILLPYISTFGITEENSFEMKVPKDWRKANITPIFKKGRKEDLGNYRLISLTSVPGKLMEQLIPETISTHMKVIRSRLHGFTKGKIILPQPDNLL